MSDDRRRAVLHAIVEDYVSTSEPVGSKALATRQELGVSPATIRNDMAALEEEGLIAQPHTSAGRIPTDKGYRSFVDHISASALQSSQKSAITTFLSDAVDVNDVVERSVRLLSQLTRQVAVVQYPAVRQSAVRRVELVRLDAHRALAVVVSADARVEHSTIALDGNPRDDGDSSDHSGPSDDEFERIAREVNRVAVGATSSELQDSLAAWSASPGQPAWAAALGAAVAKTGRGGTVERVVFAGTANLARAGTDFEADAMGSVLDALEEQVVLLRLLHEMTGQSQDVAVRIGSETRNEALTRTSIVAAGYGADNGGLSLLGALGPTRMDYPGTMAAVRAVARYLSKVVEA